MNLIIVLDFFFMFNVRLLFLKKRKTNKSFALPITKNMIYIFKDLNETYVQLLNIK